MRRALALVAAAGALLLSGCSTGPTTGVVTSLSHRAAYSYLTSTEHCSGKPDVCRTQYNPVLVSECWRVNIDDPRGHHGAWCVSADRWRAIHVGDHFSAQKGDRTP